MADKVLATRVQLRRDTKDNWASKNPTLLLGEVGIESDTLRRKVGDGSKTWTALRYVDTVFTELTIDSSTTDATDAEALADIKGAKQGDVATVKREIGTSTGKYTYTGYVYQDAVGDVDPRWEAMDGNYSAENVYLSDDITLAGDYTQVGNLTKTKTGTATFATKGKTVAQALTEIFSKRLQPEITKQPSVSIGGTQSNSDVEIGTTITKSGTFTSTFNDGTYTYGYVGDTVGNTRAGVSASAWAAEVKYTAGKSGSIATGTTASTTYSYSFKLGKAADGADAETVSVNFATTATHGDGQIARDNLGAASDPVLQIAAGTKSKDSTATYTCYRKMFYGTRTDKTDLDSTKIRALTGEKAAAKASNSLTISIPVGAMRVIVALPAGRTLTSVKDQNDSQREIISAFDNISTVAVEGADGYAAANYTVYICDYASPTTLANTYKATIA